MSDEIANAMNIARSLSGEDVAPAGNMKSASRAAFSKLIGASGAQPVRLPPGAPEMRHTDEAPTYKSIENAFKKAIDYHTGLEPRQRALHSQKAKQALQQYLATKSGMTSLIAKNSKLEKAVSLPDGTLVTTTGMSLSPAYKEGGFDTCSGNHASCDEDCLGWTSGQFYAGAKAAPAKVLTGSQRLAAFKRTQAMFRNPEAFAVRLFDEIEAAKRQASMDGAHLGVRLNVLSDIPPHILAPFINGHPDVSFYDYTKLYGNPVAPNHHLTYSSTGATQRAGLNGMNESVLNLHQNWRRMRTRLNKGDNVAMAFSNKDHIPEFVHDEETGKTYKVVDGNAHDFRPLDMQPEGADGVIIGLTNKNIEGKSHEMGSVKKSKGFFVAYDPKYKKNEKGVLVKGADGKPIPTNKTVTIGRQGTLPDQAQKGKQ